MKKGRGEKEEKYEVSAWVNDITGQMLSPPSGRFWGGAAKGREAMMK